MKIKTILEYNLKGERNNRPRKPVVFSGKVFVIFVYDKKGFIESKIQCLNITNFSLEWEYTHPHVINNLVLTEYGSLVASCMNGELLNFQTGNGTLIWTYKTQGGNIGPVSNEVDSRVVFSGVHGNQCSWCINTVNGEEIWCVGNSGHSYHPHVYGNKVLNTIGNDLYCLDLNTGKTLWKASEPKTYLFNPVAANDIVIAPGHGQVNFYALENGKFLSSIKTGQPTHLTESSIRDVFTDKNSIYFGDAKGVFYSYILSGSGSSFRTSLQWKIETQGGIESTPALFYNSILVINNGKQFLCIDQGNGDIKQEIKTKGAAFISGVTVDKDMIYYSCHGGTLVKCTIS
ncbi:MAG: PQQ-binding-like beta-propeller repeat protein [Bacteroidota bacterium]